MCPCVRVWVKGNGCSRLRTPGEGNAQPGGGMGWVQAQPHPQFPVAGASHACGVGFGAPLEAESRGGWLLAGCTSLPSPLQHHSQGCTATVCSSLLPPNQVLTPFLEPPQLHPGVPTPLPALPGWGGSTQPTSAFAVAAGPSLPALGKRWWPDPAARCGQGQLCLNTLRYQSRSNRARGMHQLDLCV